MKNVQHCNTVIYKWLLLDTNPEVTKTKNTQKETSNSKALFKIKLLLLKLTKTREYILKSTQFFEKKGLLNNY